MCAARAAAGGCSVLVVEHNDRPGKKIRISGGGRCNFTNRSVTHRNMISRNPDFARSALAGYGPGDFIELVESYGIAWHEKKLGQLFCDGSAQQIIDMLMSECRRSQVEIAFDCHVNTVTKSDLFMVEYMSSSGAKQARAGNLVVATGGLSIPSLGASDLGYRIAEHFGHPIIEPLPALVPLTFGTDFTGRFGDLSGVSLEANVRASSALFRENVLFTHRGLSGPAILQISSYLRDDAALEIDLLPDVDARAVITDYPSERRQLRSVLALHLPQRLVDVWDSPLLSKPVNTIARRDVESLLTAMKHWRLTASGTEGYAKAEVTSGGVCTSRLSSKTMQSSIVDGLYFIGEVVDVTGWLGGYNFQWAWSSAASAAAALTRR
ncbi:MAG: aminoacetone oxidase family FAD-binding enzyme [Candidatus Kapabacteria bacterium]|nr:aminoacetone oxidase family FAD-binding enzyme [Candidatus Kapabacteria bacterium]